MTTLGFLAVAAPVAIVGAMFFYARWAVRH